MATKKSVSGAPVTLERKRLEPMVRELWAVMKKHEATYADGLGALAVVIHNIGDRCDDPAAIASMVTGALEELRKDKPNKPFTPANQSAPVLNLSSPE